MSTIETLERNSESVQWNQLRLMPGVILVELQWLIRYLLLAPAPKAMAIGT